MTQNLHHRASSSSRHGHGGLSRERRPRPASRRRWRPNLERLDSRVLLAVDITTFNLTNGTLTFTGNRRGTKQDALVLVGDDDWSRSYLTHNLLTVGGNGKYADNMDIDSGNGYARLKIGTGNNPLITVTLGSNTDQLTLEDSWSFDHKMSYNGGNGIDTSRRAKHPADLESDRHVEQRL